MRWMAIISVIFLTFATPIHPIIMIEKYINLLKSFGDALHLGESTSLAFAETIATLSLALACLILYFLVRFIIKKTVYTIIQKSTNKYDDMLVKNKVISRLCLLVPALLFGAILPNTLPDFPATVTALTKLNTIFEIIIFTMILSSIVTNIRCCQTF